MNLHRRLMMQSGGVSDSKIIFYTTTDNQPLTPRIEGIKSNVYQDGFGKIVLKDDLVFFPDYAFNEMPTLRSIILPKSCISLGVEAFRKTSILEFDCESIQSIGRNAFNNTPIVRIGDMPNLVSIGNRILNYAYNIVSVGSMPNLQDIGDYTFCQKHELESVGIINVKKINNYAFDECRKLVNFGLNWSIVETIGIEAFRQCYAINEHIRLDSIKSIGALAFSTCNSIKSITIPNPNPNEVSCDTTSFRFCTFPIYVPAESVSEYKSASGWSTFANLIQPIQ